MTLKEVLADSYNRIGRPAHLLLAFSGGMDSTALLYALVDVQINHAFRISCVHINHGLRKASVVEEQHAVQAACLVNVPIFVKRVSVQRSGNLEASAREARYKAIVEVQQEIKADVIALAHHADDQAETLLMHLMHGAGSDGLAGMGEFVPPFWRPLLNTPKSCLQYYLQNHSIQWVEDESNQDTGFLRNFLRLKVLPLLESASPGSVLRFARTANIVRDEQSAWVQAEDNWLKQYSKCQLPFVFLLVKPLKVQNIAFQRRLLRRICSQYDIQLDFQQTERLRHFMDCAAGSKLNLPNNAAAFLSATRLHILPNAVKSMKVSWYQPDIKEPGNSLGNGIHEQVIDADALPESCMRQVCSTDSIKPYGMSGSQTVMKYLSARGVDVPFRPYWPVFARGDQVIWIPGCGIAQAAAVTTSTKSRIRLVFNGNLPYEINHDGGKRSDVSQLSEK